MTVSAEELVIGVTLDLALGDPRWMPHPVRGFGWIVNRLERIWRAVPLSPRVAGSLFWCSAVGVACAVVGVGLSLVPRPWSGGYWIFSLLALRQLDREASAVVAASDIEAARKQLATIVGRDTQQLDDPEILRATVETVAENLSDGVIAPLFYLGIGGPIGMAAYKAINTLDSMVGHRNDRYREFGWAAARMDDLANLIPARLTAVLVWCCALLPGFDFRRSVGVTLRDARQQPSPNSGYPEAAFAGALGIRLGGVNSYGGVTSHKSFLGDPLRKLTRQLVPRVRFLLYAPALLSIAVLYWVVS
ncbi:MAG: adenosylcobinamide-phosphate synthase CbiB [Bryobacteraceae bacterium]